MQLSLSTLYIYATVGSLAVITNSLSVPDPSFRDSEIALLKNVLGSPVIKSLIEVGCFNKKCTFNFANYPFCNLL